MDSSIENVAIRKRREWADIIVVSMLLPLAICLTWQTQRSLVSIGVEGAQSFYAEKGISQESGAQFAFASPTGLLSGPNRDTRAGTMDGKFADKQQRENGLSLEPAALANPAKLTGEVSITSGLTSALTPTSDRSARYSAIELLPERFFFLPLAPGGTIGSTSSEPTAPAPDPTPVSSVPEPQVWTMLILGFFVLAGTMRRRKTARQVG